MELINQKLGIITGYGLLPEIFIKEVQNLQFFIVGFNRFTSKKLLKYAKGYLLLKEWKLQEIIDFFQYNEVKKILFLGYIPHKILFSKSLQLDKKAKDLFNRLKKNSAMDIFYGLLDEFKNVGIEIEPIDKYLKNSFAEKGSINGLIPTEEEFENIEFGYKIAKQIASLDIGLTVVVKNKVIVAVEALEGTDSCILRASKLAGEGCVVVKVARPNQDMRFDLPVIGPKTVKILTSAKVKVIAVESDKTLILNKKEVIERTKKSGIKLYGI